ncbi:MAG: RNA polymerase sigma factor, partial [Acidimicrobiales bacterium]
MATAPASGAVDEPGAPPDLVTFCREEWPRLVGALALYCGDRDTAEELAQEALVRVWRHWPNVREAASPRAWAHRVAINLANSWFRATLARRRAMSRLDPQGGDAHDDQDTAHTLAVREAVAALPE